MPPSAEITITDLAHDGRGVGRIDARVVFVEGALPGERVRTGPLHQRGKIAEAKLVELLQPSAQRRPPLCPHYAQCGGCSLQHLSYPAQLQARQAHLAGQLQRAGIQPGHFLPAVGSPEYGYRRRARLVVDWRRRRAGFRRKASNAIVEVIRCPVLIPQLEKLLPRIAQMLEALPERIDELELVETGRGIELILHAASDRRQPVSLALPEGVQRILCRSPQGVCDLLTGQPVDDAPGFMQANELVNGQLGAAVVDRLQPLTDKAVADFFCGAGNFSLALARAGARVTGYEVVPSAVEQARREAPANASFQCANLFDPRVLGRIRKELAGFDALLLDPPRAGASELCQLLGRFGPPQLLYLSCHPATFVRDARYLLDGGYRMHSLQMFDMFPQTMHAELLAVFQRA